jgi:SagB-type dehydrogenase family enzyme
MAINEKEYGDIFQQRSKYSKTTKWESLDWQKKLPIYKQYSGQNQILLPKFNLDTNYTVEQIFRSRKSVRNFTSEAISMEQLSTLLWACTGISRIEGDYAFRTAPSAGALYPIETYVVSNHINELPPGIYHYNIYQHTLTSVKEGLQGEILANAALGQIMCASAPLVLIWTAIFQRSRWKYRQRAYRYIYLDAGHIGENLALAAVALGLGSCQIGAFYDDEINAIVNVDGEQESAIYLSVVGVPAMEQDIG